MTLNWSEWTTFTVLPILPHTGVMQIFPFCQVHYLFLYGTRTLYVISFLSGDPHLNCPVVDIWQMSTRRPITHKKNVKVRSNGSINLIERSQRHVRSFSSNIFAGIFQEKKTCETWKNWDKSARPSLHVCAVLDNFVIKLFCELLGNWIQNRHQWKFEKNIILCDKLIHLNS